jgi:AraC-like DNA-binding protein
MGEMLHKNKNRHVALEHDFSYKLMPCLGNVGWSLFSRAMPHALEPHRHQHAFEVCYIKRGSTSWRVGDDIFDLQPGELFMTWPNELHGGVDGIMHPCEIYWVIFSLTPEAGSFGMLPLETGEMLGQLNQINQRRCRVSAHIADHFEHLLAAVISEQPFSGLTARASMQLLLCDVLEAFSAPDADPPTRRGYAPRIQRAIHWMHREIGHEINIEDAARIADLKSSQFRKQFQRETGFSPIEYLTRIRIQKAKGMLLETDASITDIAFSLGFSSSQYFATVFRKSTGTTPREFRNSYANAEGDAPAL